MEKLIYFLKAIKSNAFLSNHWIFSCFSLTSEDEGLWKKDPYPYRLVQTPTGFYFVDPENNNELTQLKGTILGSPAFTFKDRIELNAGDLKNLDEDIITTTGNVIFNCICIINAFGSKIKFINKRASVSSIENQIAPLLEDTPEPDTERSDKVIYVDEYLKFVNSVFHLTNFNQLCVWGATRKVITPPPGIAEFKKQLFEKYKDSLNNSTTIARIDKELVDYDAKYLAGDPGLNFLLSNKSRAIVRKKKYLFYGAEPGLDDSVNLNPIENSLEEGWDIKRIPEMITGLRAGSFNRGAQTELGGESVKWLLRASSNIVITKEDCGSRVGKPFEVTSDNHRKLVDFSIVTNEGHKLITTEDDTGQYIGKKLMVRSPMYCKLDLTDFCSVCVGKKLAKNPTGLSLTISEYGSSFLSLFMAAAHAKQLTLQKADLNKIIS
jgi:hypothetical protein